MKRFLALFLALLCIAVTVCGCGDKDKSPSNSKADGNVVVNSGDSDEDKSSTDYKTYDDLPRSERLGTTDMMINTFDCRTESYGFGFSTSDSLDYAVVAASSEYPEEGLSIDDSFADFYDGDYQTILKQFNRATYADYVPEITDRVTLACGAEAVKFEGIQEYDDYGTVGSYHVYGYGFVYNGYTVIASYIANAAEGKVDDAKKAELAGYVDEMIHTIRTEA